MFTRILVPLDGSPESNIALPVARTMAHATGASIVLLQVLPSAELQGDQGLDTGAAEKLTRVARELSASGLQVASTVRHGQATDEILHQVDEQRADLVIMATHGRAGVERAVMGSVAEGVLSHREVPVVTLRPGGRRIDHIANLIVPLDGSPGGALALASAVGLAKATGAQIHLLEVVIPIPFQAWAAYDAMMYYDPAWDEEALTSAQMYLRGMVTRLRAAGVAAKGEVRAAPDVAKSIVQVAEELTADLIVMSTHALTGLPRALLGSIADAVVRTAHSPVLLIHRSRSDN